MLRIENLTFAHPGQTAPYQFDLEVAPGEIVAISGTSGSGKSTLLDLVAGFLTPTNGEIALDDRSLLPLPPEERPVSILFQDNNLFDHLTVAQNIALGLQSTHGSEQAISDVLKRVGLEGYAPRRARSLSGGQQQRVALARTLLRDKPILLLDEPFTGLDAETASSMRDLVKDLTNAKNWHVVLVSHDEDDAVFLADRRFDLSGNQLTERAKA